MPSPDVSNYIDLTLYDQQPSEIYDAALEYAQTSLPEWTPIAGSVEDAILQAASSMTAYLGAAINRLPAGNIEGLLRLFGVERNSGTAPTATVNIVFIDASPRSLPAGTRFGYLDTSGTESVLYIFETIDDLTTSSASVATDIRGISLSEYPAISNGTSLQLLSAVSSIQSVTLTSNLSVGADPETQLQFVNRAIAKFASLSESLATSNQFASYALTNYPSVYRAKAFSRLSIQEPVTSLTYSGASVTAEVASGHNIAAGDFVRIVDAVDSSFNGYFSVDSTDATHIYWSQSATHASTGASATITAHSLQTPNTNGYVAIYVSDLNGASVSASTLADIETTIAEKAIAGLTIRADNAKIADVDIAVSVTIKAGNLASTVSTAVENAVEDYISPDKWTWEQTIYVNEIIGLVDRIAGVDRVVSVTITDTDNSGTDDGNGNLVFDYFGVLPRAATTVTVV